MIKSPTFKSRRGALIAKFILVGAIAYPVGVWAQSNSVQTVSQKNRTYAPGSMQVKQGGAIKIINDDIFLHQAYIDADDMQYESGSMEEGESVEITFKTKGTYQVRCAIHPKMKLSVTVN